MSENTLLEARKAKFHYVREHVNPYPERYARTHELCEAAKLLDGVQDVCVAGRVTAIRRMGKLSFVTLSDMEGKLQIAVMRDEVGEDTYDFFKRGFDVGDFMGAEGEIFTTKVGEKTREAIARIQGDIPKVAIKRTKDENELNEYEIMVAMTSANPDLRALVEAWAEDTQFCWDGVAARLEWIALQSISLGKVTLTNENNNSVITEYDVDYQIDATQKVGFQTGSAAWNTTGAKPFSKDFKAIVAKAKKKGIRLKYAFMNLDTFSLMAQTEEVVKLSASFAANALNIAQTPSLEQVNAAMKGLAYLRGLQVVVIDQDITIEKDDGSRPFSGNPFADDVVMFSESKVLGSTYWKKPADMNLKGSVAIKAMNGHTCVKKYSTEEPIEEVTVGIANAFPAWLSSGRSFLMDTSNSTWTH